MPQFRTSKNVRYRGMPNLPVDQVCRTVNCNAGNSVVFRRVRVVQPYGVTPLCDIAIVKGRIEHLGGQINHGTNTAVVEGNGRIIAPGFIDIHCHSDGKHSFFEHGETVAETLLRSGTTGVLATLAYCDMVPGKIHQQVESYWNSRGSAAQGIVLGVHLEGPYTNPRYGALVSPDQVYAPDPEEYNPIFKHCSEYVKMWTIAPELTGIPEFAQAASNHGIILAAGHCEASVKQLQALIPLGLRVATHWSNATGTLPPRYAGTRCPGIDEFALVEDAMIAEVICDADGLHVDQTMLRLLYRAKGPEGIILISDAYWSEEKDAPVSEDCDVHFTRDGMLNGSNLTMLAAARNMRKHVGCDLPELFRMGSLNPAKLFGWDREMGSVEPGKMANLLLVDEDLRLHGVWLGGRQVTG